jgi:hypothetical protein
MMRSNIALGLHRVLLVDANGQTPHWSVGRIREVSWPGNTYFYPEIGWLRPGVALERVVMPHRRVRGSDNAYNLPPPSSGGG